MHLMVEKGIALFDHIYEEIVVGSLHNVSYTFGLNPPFDSMVLAAFAVTQALQNASSDNLLQAYSHGEVPYRFYDTIDRKVVENLVSFKDDSLGLDILPEQCIAEILTSRLSQSASGPGIFNSSVISKHVVISEECGRMPITVNLIDSDRIFVIDPLDGSKILKSYIEGDQRTITPLRSSYPLLLAPNIGISCIENGVVNTSLLLNLVTGEYYSFDQSGAHKFIHTISVSETSDNKYKDISLNVAGTQQLEIRPFSESDKSMYICYSMHGVYDTNLNFLALSDIAARYDAADLRGPTRPLLFTTESQDHRPRFVLYNGEKLCEWIHSLNWCRTFPDVFSAYVFSNPDAPSKGGHSMAPLPGQSIIRKDGTLDFTVMDDDPNPAQYRSTIAIVYNEDKELNRHLDKIGAMRLYS